MRDNVRRTTPNPRISPYVFTGLLVCGKCGGGMVGDTFNKRRAYTCCAYKDRNSCERYNIYEDQLLPVVVGALQEQLFDPSIWNRVRKSIIKKLTSGQDTAREDLERQIASLDKKIDSASQRLLEVSKRHIEWIEKQLDELEAKKARLEAELEEVPVSNLSTAEINEWLDEASETFSSLRRATDTMTSPQDVRRLMHGIVRQIEVDLDRVPEKPGGKRHKCIFRGGLMELATMEGCQQGRA